MNAPLKTNVATTLDEIPFFALSEAEQISTIESSLYPGAKHESIKLVLANCRAQVLDPMTKPFHIVPMQVKQRKSNGEGTEYVWRDVVMPGIELYRTKAARTGAYAGLDPAKWGGDCTENLGGEDKLEWDYEQRRKVVKGKYETVTMTYPEWCEVTVYRIVQGVRCAFPSGRVYWKETYATAGRGTSLPNEMWRKRTRGQLEKCAEALALRRGFPEIGAMPTAEEMIGKVLDPDVGSGIVVEGIVADKKVEQPHAKSETRTESAPAAPSVSTSSSSEAGGEAPDAKTEESQLLSEGAKATLRRTMKRACRTEADLVAAGFTKIDEMRFARFNEMMDWLKKNPAKGA